MLLTATTIIATLAGLAAAAVFPRDQGSGFKILSQAKIDKYSPFSYYAAAATCSTQNVAAWQCGSACLVCDHPFFSPRGRRVGSNARYRF